MNARPLAGLTILIVEDTYLIALEVQRMVEEAGAQRATLAATVSEVRERLAAGRPIDVCILDLRLGEEDATPLIEELRERGIAVLVATGFDSVGPNVDVPLLQKPYQEAELVAAIRAALGERD
ncbi:MAG: response regulator [Propylenella sp.]